MLRRSMRVLIFLLKASRRVSPKTDSGGITGYSQNCYRKMRKFCQPLRHLGEILLLIVLLAHVDRFEQSSSPPERNIKWPKMGGS